MFAYGLLAVLIVRLTIPLIILKKPFLGSLLGVAADASDIYFFYFLGGGISSDAYNMIDKLLDMYTLTIMLIVLSRDNAWYARKTGLILYFYRVIGFFVYELTKSRAILFIFPNIFEFYTIFYFGLKAFKKERALSNKIFFTVSLLLLLTLKLVQEYALHVAQVPFFPIINKIIGLW